MKTYPPQIKKYLQLKQFNEFKKYIDLCVYDKRLLRLPYQTAKPDKLEIHELERGSMINFIVECLYDNARIGFNFNDWCSHNNIKQKKEYKIKTTLKKKCNIEVSDEQIGIMLNKLDSDYSDNYKEWTIITNILKGLDKFDLWNNFSKQSTRYNYNKNVKIWKSMKKIVFDIGYLMAITKSKIINKILISSDQVIDTFKDLPENTIQPNRIMTHPYLTNNNDSNLDIFKLSDLQDFDTIIIQSCTGTGKTTATAKHFKAFNENRYVDIKILSIIDRITLANQHVKSFNDYNIKIDNYENTKFDNQNYVVCINSLMKIRLTSDDLKNYIVYIDEINSFIKHLTHNETLDRNLKDIFTNLIFIIKHAYKVVVSDAVISDNVFDLLNIRKGAERSEYNSEPTLKSKDFNVIYIKNDYKKYENIKAVRMRDENEFFDKINDHIENNKHLE